MDIAPVTELRICPTQRAADHAWRDAGDRTAVAWMTFAQLFQRIGAGEGRAVGALETDLLVRQAILRTAGLEGAARDPRRVRAFARALYELRQAGIERRLPVTPGREVAAMLTVLGHYEDLLAARGGMDAADSERAAVLAVAEGGLPPVLASVQRVVVSAGVELFGARLDLLSAWAAVGAKVKVTVNYDPRRAHAFAWTEAVVHALEHRAHAGVEVRFDDRVGTGPLAPIRGVQFTDAVASGPARVVQVGGRAEHARRAAHEVARALREGLAPEEVAVACADLAGLGTAIGRALDLLGVPWTRTQGPSASQSRAGRLLPAALRLGFEGLGREPLVEVLEVSGGVAAAGERWGAASVARALRQAGVRSARGVDVGAALQHNNARYRGRSSAGKDGTGRALAEALSAQVARLAAVPESASWAEWVTVARALWKAMRPPEAPAQTAPTEAVVDAPDARWWAHRVAQEEQALEAVDRMLDAAAALSDSASATFSAPEFAELLTLLLEGCELRAPGPSWGAVTIGTPADFVGCRYRALVVAGVDTGLFPRPAYDDTVLSETVRRALNHVLGPRLRQASSTSERAAVGQHDRDRVLWLELLAAAQEQLVVVHTLHEGFDHEGRSEIVEVLLQSLGQADADLLVPPVFRESIPGSPGTALEAWVAGQALPESLSGAPEAQVDLAVDPAAVASWSRAMVQARAHGQGAASLGSAGQRRVRERVRDQVHSPSQLDQLATCPYRYFAGSLLGLRREDEVRLGADAREEGNAMHAGLYWVYRDVRERGGLAQARRSVPEALRRAREVLTAHEDDVFAEASVHPHLREATLEGVWLVVRRRLEADLQREDGFEPTFLEFRFDDRPDADAPPLVLRGPGGEALRVRGSVDRVDRKDDVMRVLDYKRTYKPREPGRHLQLPLYAAAVVQQCAGTAESLTEVSAGWVGLKDGRTYNATDVVGSPETLLAEVQSRVWAAVDRVRRGDIRPAPAPVQSCKACDFGALCRYRPDPAGAEEAS